MSRIPDIDPKQTRGYIARVLEAQTATWGAPLKNHLVYAHRPDLFKAARGMWGAIDKDALIGPALLSLINRRVAGINGCLF